MENKRENILTQKDKKLIEMGKHVAIELSKQAWNDVTSEASKKHKELNSSEFYLLIMSFLGNFSSQIISNLYENLINHGNKIIIDKITGELLILIMDILKVNKKND